MDAWAELHDLFDTDDSRVLYDIHLTGLDARGLAAGFAFVRGRSVVTPDAEFWHVEADRGLRVSDYTDAAGMVAAGVCEEFHVLAPGLRFRETTLPDLGLRVSPGELTFDYRMGPEWGRPELLALFEMLSQLIAATGGRVRLGTSLATSDDLFARHFEAYRRTAAGPPGG